jgi:hypothetical protein
VSVVITDLSVHPGGGKGKKSFGVVTFESKAFTGPLGHLKVRQKIKRIKKKSY